jgi:S-adenosylmethionine-diacylglycerol 3-amino-3-carboxypropyl transferase
MQTAIDQGSHPIQNNPNRVNEGRSRELLNHAVFGHKEEVTITERIFAYWFRRLVYTQIWEDPVVDMAALNVQPSDHIVTIASGGCNALSYLTGGAAQVTAVDLNHAHVCLVKLKIAAVEGLTNHADFFQLFGMANTAANTRLYQQKIAHLLDDDAREYWEGGPLGFKRIRMFAKGFYKYGLLGQIIGILHLAARIKGVKLEELLQQPDLASQEKWFDEKVAAIFDSKLVKRLCTSPLALYNLGIPPSQHQALCEDQPLQMAEVLKERARRIATVTPVRENYFAWQAYGRRYDVTGNSALPPYLMRENYFQLRDSINRLSITQSNIRQALTACAEQSVDAVVLLDAQDWMSPTEITLLWQEITRTAKPGARVIFRTAGIASPVDACLTGGLEGRWVKDIDVSAEASLKDRSGIYGGFHLYRLQAQ